MNYYAEVLKNIECLSRMSVEDFGGIALYDIERMAERGALFYSVENSELMLVAYSDEFGRSKNRVRWYQIPEKPISHVSLLDFDDAFDLVPEECKEDLVFHLELFSDSVPKYIVDVVGDEISNKEVPYGLPRKLDLYSAETSSGQAKRLANLVNGLNDNTKPDNV